MTKVNIPFVFDATGIEPSTGGMTVIPTGEYAAKIVNMAGPKPNKKQDGQILVMTMEILDTEYAGAILMHNLNIDNPSAQAVEIAQAELSAICHVTNTLVIQNLGQLCEKPFKMRVEETTYENKEGKTVPTNNIKGFMDMGGNAPSRGQAPQAGQPAPAVTAAPAPSPAPVTPPVGQPPIQTPGVAPSPAPAPQQAAGGWGGNAAAPTPPATGAAPAPAPAGFGNPNPAPQ